MFSTVWNTQRGSRSYIERGRGRKEIEVTRRRRGGVKRRETDLASNHFHKFLQSEGHPQRYTELHGEEKQEEGDRSDQEEKRGNQKGREQASQ